MRQLHILGIDRDANQLVCEEKASGDRYTVPIDDTLHAALRGELPTMTDGELRYDFALTPREIQHRVRSGQSIAEIASLAGVPIDRVERFAHPVMLERARVAQMALAAHPIRNDGPSVDKLSSLVYQSLSLRGVSPDSAEWDSWKSADGVWVVQASWAFGMSRQLAHWQYTPGAHGGVVTELDDAAHELTNPTYQPRLQVVAGASIRSLVTAPSEEVFVDVEEEHEPERPLAEIAAEELLELVQPGVNPRPHNAGRRKGQTKSRSTAVPAWEDVLLGVRSAHQ